MRKATLPLVALLSILALLTPRSQAQTFTVLHSFSGPPDGIFPLGGLVRDKAGNLYGTTITGGSSSCIFMGGCGTVFTVDTTGKETVIYSFSGGMDGASPLAGLVRDKAGNLYGTTEVGGSSNLGTVFKVDTTGKETVIHSFSGGTDGEQPLDGVVRDKAGNLYGTTLNGGSGCGTVF